MLMQTTLWVPFIKQMKQLAQIQQQQQAGSSQQQQQQSAAPQQQQQDRLAGVPVDISTSFRSSDPVYGGVEPSSGTNSTGTGKVCISLNLMFSVPSCFHIFTVKTLEICFSHILCWVFRIHCWIGVSCFTVWSY
jgi:hypothetical protein